MIVLRPYQTRDIERLGAAYVAGSRAILYCLPTGGGKTIVFAYIAHGVAAKGRRVGVVVHRRELIRQASDKLKRAGVSHEIVAASLERSS
jgi:DNA repair protein RadD